MQQYKIGDIFIRIKNATMARRSSVEFTYSKLTKEILHLLESEGFLTEIVENTEKAKKSLSAKLAKVNRVPLFTDVKIISRPSLRVYKDAKKIKTMNGRTMGTLIVSTSQGIMTGKTAVEKGVGGEVLVEVW